MLNIFMLEIKNEHMIFTEVLFWECIDPVKRAAFVSNSLAIKELKTQSCTLSC